MSFETEKHDVPAREIQGCEGGLRASGGNEPLRHESACHEPVCHESACHESGGHESIRHEHGQMHHHHTHAASSHHAGGHHLLQVEDLSVSFDMYEADAPFFRAKRRPVKVIESLSVSVHAGEVVAVVGASGSGKTLLADAVMGLFEPNATVEGRVWFDGVRVDGAGLQALRGNGISLVPQSVAHLNPLMKVGKQVRGVGRTKAERRARAARQRELFAHYGLAPEVEERYPHELSGGMARRVLLCCALMDDPQLIVADEPTPGLDLELAVRALDDLRAFADVGGGVLLITHDIELALRVADRVAVFKDGTVVEETAVASFADPARLRHPFTRALWHALPEHDFAASTEATGTKGESTKEAAGGTLARKGERSVKVMSIGGGEAEEGEVKGRKAEEGEFGKNDAVATGDEKAEPSGQATSHAPSAIVRERALEARGVSFGYESERPLYRDFSFAVHPGERVALVAPSGFGKTTLCRLLAGYEEPQRGSIIADGVPLPKKGACPVQLIGQHPERTVDPLARMHAVLEEAGPIDARLCRELGIKDEWMRRFPHELSGGELQRFCIARALTTNPRYVVADEISTMLDAVTQAQLWDFLVREVQERQMGLVFVSHVPALVERIATRVVRLGQRA